MKQNLILTDGGMGDLICQLVAVDYNIKHNPHIEFQVWLPDYLYKFAMHVLPANTKVFPFSQAKKLFNPKLPGRTSQWFEHSHTPMRTHPVDYGFHALADKHIYNLNEKNYLQIRPENLDISRFNLPDDYVCIVTTAAEPVKELPANVLNEIIEYVREKHTPVFIGKEKSSTGFQDLAVNGKVIPVDYSKGINLLNQTSMLEAAAVIAGSKTIIGMDGGLIHLAGCTQAEIVAGYTLADPQHLAPIRNGTQSYNFQAVEPDSHIENRYFQSNNSFYPSDYRKFPNWENVIKNLTAEKFIAKLNL